MCSSTLKSVSEWYVYLIRDRNNSLYCGISTDVDRRFAQHSAGKGAKALKGKGPLELVWSERVGDSRSLALKVEYKVKRLKKTQKEQLIKQQTDLANLVDINLLNTV